MIPIMLGVNETIRGRLDALRLEFTKACNWVAPIAKNNHCWNRVALHHLSYHGLREAFPGLGAQMACNAIYSVCRCYRLILGHPQSPLYKTKITHGQLPFIFFLDSSPVFFDRHTLSLNKNVLSLFTLEGRLHFQVTLSEEDEHCFRTQKLQEIQLVAKDQDYLLMMNFGSESSAINMTTFNLSQEWPNYFVLMDEPTKYSEHDPLSANAEFMTRKVSGYVGR